MFSKRTATLFYVERLERHIHAEEEVCSFCRMIELVLIVPVKDVVNAQEDTEIRLRLIAQIKICRKVAGAVRILFTIRPSAHSTSEQGGAQLTLTVGNTKIKHLCGEAGSNGCFSILLIHGSHPRVVDKAGEFRAEFISASLTVM